MAQKPKSLFRVGENVLHKVRYYVRGKERVKWESAKILQKIMFEPRSGVYCWGYRIRNTVFPTFEGETEFKKVPKK